MKNPAQAIDFYNFDRLRFKSNIVKIIKTDIYRKVGDISGFINGFNITDINQLMRQYEEYINKGPKN